MSICPWKSEPDTWGGAWIRRRTQLRLIFLGESSYATKNPKDCTWQRNSWLIWTWATASSFVKGRSAITPFWCRSFVEQPRGSRISSYFPYHVSHDPVVFILAVTRQPHLGNCAWWWYKQEKRCIVLLSPIYQVNFDRILRSAYLDSIVSQTQIQLDVSRV